MLTQQYNLQPPRPSQSASYHATKKNPLGLLPSVWVALQLASFLTGL